MSQLLEKQRTARMTGSLDCACPDSTCLDSKTCIHQVTTTKHTKVAFFIDLPGAKFNWKTLPPQVLTINRENVKCCKAVKTETPTTTSRSRSGRGSMMHHTRHMAESNQVDNVLMSCTPPAKTDTNIFFVPKVCPLT